MFNQSVRNSLIKLDKFCQSTRDIVSVFGVVKAKRGLKVNGLFALADL